jgi:hypothetical protein
VLPILFDTRDPIDSRSRPGVKLCLRRDARHRTRLRGPKRISGVLSACWELLQSVGRLFLRSSRGRLVHDVHILVAHSTWLTKMSAIRKIRWWNVCRPYHRSDDVSQIELG